jgi:penicillin-binding protein 1A
MKKCYEDTSLKVSKEDFDRPANLSIKVDCYTRPAVVKDTTAVEQDTEEF